MKKYNKNYKIVKGFLCTDEFGIPACITYFWLENDMGAKFDVIKAIKNTRESYFLTEDMLVGVDCIDRWEPGVTMENDLLWKSIISTNDIDSVLRIISKSHPIKI